MGTDTGGSIRGPSTSNGVVGLKPTHGLLSRAGIVPLALSFDTGGPLALNVADVAAALGAMTGIDPADAATQKSADKFETDYTRYLKADALKGARIGIARDFMGQDQEVDWVIEASLDAMRKQGATIVEVHYPKWLLQTKTEFYNVIRRPEFAAQITDYLITLKPGYPRSHKELMDLSETLTSPPRRLHANGSRCGAVQGRSEQRHIDQSPIFGRARSWIAAGARRNRGHIEFQSARRHRLSDLPAPAGPHRCGPGARRDRRRIRDQFRQSHRFPRFDRARRLHHPAACRSVFPSSAPPSASRNYSASVTPSSRRPRRGGCPSTPPRCPARRSALESHEPRLLRSTRHRSSFPGVTQPHVQVCESPRRRVVRDAALARDRHADARGAHARQVPSARGDHPGYPAVVPIGLADQHRYRHAVLETHQGLQRHLRQATAGHSGSHRNHPERRPDQRAVDLESEAQDARQSGASMPARRAA